MALAKAIRRQDWRRGPQDCALHLMPPPQSGACRQAWHIDSHAPVVGLCPFPIAAVVQAAFVG